MSQTAAGELSQTAVWELCETAVWELCETAVWEVSQTAAGELSQTAVWQLSETAVWELSETAVWELSQTAAWELSQTAPWELSQTAVWQLSETVVWQLSETAVWETAPPAPQHKVKPKQLLILRKKVSNFFHSRGVCAVNFVLGARGSMRLPWIDRIDEITDPIDRIDEITVNRSDRCDSLGPIGSMIATQIRVGGPSWRAATRQLGPPTRNTTGNARVGGLADRFLLRIYSLRVFILKNRPPTRQLEHFQWCFELAGRVGGSRPANSIRQLEFA